MKHVVFFVLLFFFLATGLLRAQYFDCDEMAALHPQRGYNDLYLSGGAYSSNYPQGTTLDFCDAAVAGQVVRIWFPP